METKPKTLAESISILKNHNKWRIGDIDSSPNTPREITKAIDIVLEAAELYASEENRKKDEPKQSEPVSADVETAAREYCDETTHENTVSPERMNGRHEGFISGAKWQSQQPVSIQWLNNEEIRPIAINLSEKYRCGFGSMAEIFRIVQTELRQRVNAVDLVEFTIGFKHWCFEYANAQAYIGMSDEELISAYKDYLTSKTK